MARVEVRRLGLARPGLRRCIWAVFLVILLVLPWMLPRFYVDMLFQTLWYGALAQAWSFIGGYGKMLSLGHAAFVGLGAYTSALLFIHFNLSPWLGLLAGGVMAALLSFVVGLACFRLSGAYFAIGTLILTELLRAVFMEFPDLTGGATGLNLPFKHEQSELFMQFRGMEPFYYLVLALVLIISLTVDRFRKSDLGLQMTALGENELAARSLGISAVRVKQKVFLVSAFFSGMLGVVHVQNLMLIQVNTYFDALLSVKIALIAFVGGSRTLVGPLAGAVMLIPLAQQLQATLGGTYAGGQLIIFGLVLVLTSRFCPQGIWPLLTQKFAFRPLQAKVEPH